MADYVMPQHARLQNNAAKNKKQCLAVYVLREKLFSRSSQSPKGIHPKRTENAFVTAARRQSSMRYDTRIYSYRARARDRSRPGRECAGAFFAFLHLRSCGAGFLGIGLGKKQKSTSERRLTRFPPLQHASMAWA